MIVSFNDGGTEDVFDNLNSKSARKVCPRELWRVAQRKLAYIEAAVELRDLNRPPGNHLEKLRNDRNGQHSIRINKQYRICFVWTDKGAARVEIIDYHD